MRRRDFITLLGGAGVTWPLAARAQQPAGRVRLVRIISGFADDSLVELNLLPALSRLGWDNGRNMQIDQRFATNSNGALSGLATIASNGLIVRSSSPAKRSADPLYVALGEQTRRHRNAVDGALVG
jgi:hypothetical protein